MHYQVKKDQSRKFSPDNSVFDKNKIMKNEIKLENSDVHYI